jgi:hypothetical protein
MKTEGKSCESCELFKTVSKCVEVAAFDLKCWQPLSPDKSEKKSYEEKKADIIEEYRNMYKAIELVELLALTEGERRAEERILGKIIILKIHKYIKQWTAEMVIDNLLTLIRGGKDGK